jgi:TonB family protein
MERFIMCNAQPNVPALAKHRIIQVEVTPQETTLMNAFSTIIALALWAVGTTTAVAQVDPEPYLSFLDFGVPCADPLEEAEGPAMLHPNRSGPKSNPSSPLSQPSYPALSRRMGEEGRATLKLLVSATGEVSQAHISESTGSPRLDAAALEVTRTWKFMPGKVDGTPRCMWGRFAVTFRLTDYTDQELQAVNVPPEARTLANLIMGLDELRNSMLTSDALVSSVDRQLVELALDAASQRPEWLRSFDKVARILAVEFTPAELTELSTFFATPVASKWRSLSFKMMQTVMVEQRLIADTLMCSIGGVSKAVKDAELKLPEQSEQLSKAQADAITALVGDLAPYCACRLKMLKEPRSSKDSPGALKCGIPPKLQLAQ